MSQTTWRVRFVRTIDKQAERDREMTGKTLFSGTTVSVASKIKIHRKIVVIINNQKEVGLLLIKASSRTVELHVYDCLTAMINLLRKFSQA